MTTISVAREKIDRVLGTGAAKNPPKKLADSIGSAIARKLYTGDFAAIDLSSIKVEKSWDGRIIEIQFTKSDDKCGDASVASAVKKVQDLFENPEAHHDI